MLRLYDIPVNRPHNVLLLTVHFGLCSHNNRTLLHLVREFRDGIGRPVIHRSHSHKILRLNHLVNSNHFIDMIHQRLSFASVIILTSIKINCMILLGTSFWIINVHQSLSIAISIVFKLWPIFCLSIYNMRTNCSQHLWITII